mmetsp:Transcript_15545/g.42138  ORF Transcript_15545/g.42138 Transcript_15545/m.42138 type:complete len:274 (-) Transcript_15545:1021-1842(-)
MRGLGARPGWAHGSRPSDRSHTFSVPSQDAVTNWCGLVEPALLLLSWNIASPAAVTILCSSSCGPLWLPHSLPPAVTTASSWVSASPAAVATHMQLTPSSCASQEPTTRAASTLYTCTCLWCVPANSSGCLTHSMGARPALAACAASPTPCAAAWLRPRCTPVMQSNGAPRSAVRTTRALPCTYSCLMAMQPALTLVPMPSGCCAAVQPAAPWLWLACAVVLSVLWLLLTSGCCAPAWHGVSWLAPSKQWLLLRGGCCAGSWNTLSVPFWLAV